MAKSETKEISNIVFTFHDFQTGKAPYYVGATQTLPRGHIYTDRSKNSMGEYRKPFKAPDN
jgi:hypothetical protein